MHQTHTMVWELVAFAVAVAVHLCGMWYTSMKAAQKTRDAVREDAAEVAEQEIMPLVRAELDNATEQVIDRTIQRVQGGLNGLGNQLKYMLYGEVEEGDEFEPLARVINEGKRTWMSQLGKKGAESKQDNAQQQKLDGLELFTAISEELGPEVAKLIRKKFPEEWEWAADLGPMAAPYIVKMARAAGLGDKKNGTTTTGGTVTW